MTWSIMRNFGSKNSSLKKARKARSLNVETLEKREMLSVAPVGVEEVDFLDGNGNLKYGGTLNYTVLENDTDNRDTCIIINCVQLGGEGGNPRYPCLSRREAHFLLLLCRKERKRKKEPLWI